MSNSSSVSRRGFIAGAALATAAATIPTTQALAGSKAGQPTVADVQGGTVWGTLTEFSGGDSGVTDMHPSKTQASGFLNREPRLVPVEAKFTGTKFRITQIAWGDYAWSIYAIADPRKIFNHAGRDTERDIEWLIDKTGFAKAKILADVAALKASDHRRGGMPAHTLAVPDPIACEGGEEYFTQEEITDRAAALELTSKYNDVSTDNDEWSKQEHYRWSVVIELGELPDQCFEATMKFCGDIGVEETTGHRPIRVVRPTAGEIYRFAKPLAWE